MHRLHPRVPHIFLRPLVLLISGAAALVSPSPGAARQEASHTPRGAAPAQVMILGTYHFANPGLDLVQTQVPDILSSERQEEVERVVEALAGFRPDRVAVERLPAAAPVLDSLFAAYRRGEHVLSRDETEQIGFRLAHRFGHLRVHPVDHRGEFPFGPVMEYAAEHDPAFVDRVQKQIARITEEFNGRFGTHTIGELLRWMNGPAELAEAHGFYLELARVGAGDTQVGADLLSHWYERNIRIFSNLQAASREGERVVLIVGSGHAPILRELVRSDPRMALVDPLEYLLER